MSVSRTCMGPQDYFKIQSIINTNNDNMYYMELKLNGINDTLWKIIFSIQNVSEYIFSPCRNSSTAI